MIGLKGERFSTVGIDGCKGGWLAAVLSNEGLTIEWYFCIEEILNNYSIAGKYLIDIPIGLPDSPQEAKLRPDRAARAILKRKYASVFPAPFRSVARARNTFDAWEVNKALGGNANYMTMGIRKAVAEVDAFLQENEDWKNVLLECHPEVCFTIFNGGNPIMENKKGEAGTEKRQGILEDWGIKRELFSSHPLFNKHRDDVVDALCLAVVGRLALSGQSATIPPESEIKTDSTGIKMQMLVPTLRL